MNRLIISLFLCIIWFSCKSQIKPYDLTRPFTSVALDGTRIDLFDGEIYQWSFNGRVALFGGNHQLGLNIPFMRTDYISNVETRTGMGDIRCHYMLRLINDTLSMTKKSLAFALDYNVPTGDRGSGHGVGASVLSPALIFMVRPIDEVAGFVGLRYAHSLSAADGSWSALPSFPGQDPILEPKMRDFIVDLAGVIDFNESAWLKINFNFTAFLDENDAVLNLEPELGKIWNNRWSLSAKSRIYIGGRKRVNSIIGFNFAYFVQ